MCRDKEFFFDLFKGNSLFKKQKIPMFNVLLTSYNMLQLDYKHLININWRCVIIDEGQRLKSNDSKIFKMGMTLRTEFKVLLSGTPLQNNIHELFNLLECLDSKKFNQAFRDQFKNGFSGSIMLSANQSEHLFKRKV